MITLEEALKIAQTRRKNINQYAEYENGFVFSNTNDVDFDGGLGHSPVVVLKKDGSITDMIKFINSGTGKELKISKL